MTSVLVVQNGPLGGPRRFGRWLADAGVSLEMVHGDEGDTVPQEPEHAGVLVLGGGFMPDDDARAPWLAPTRALVRAALARELPVLGICLGGQLLARVAGGAVAADHGPPEFGSTALRLRPEAADDPLFHGLPAEVTAIERHVDAITALPPGAAWLASSERCPYQAFRVGQRAWGVQFHPEVSAGRLRHWDADWLRERGVDHEELCRTAEAAEPDAAAVWHLVARRFAAVVRGEPVPRA